MKFTFFANIFILLNIYLDFFLINKLDSSKDEPKILFPMKKTRLDFVTEDILVISDR